MADGTDGMPPAFAATAEEAAALRHLLRHLKETGYRFVTPTPATHTRVLARLPGRLGMSREDILGWSLPFAKGSISPQLEHLLAAANVLTHQADGLFRARIRVSAVHGHLFLHSAFPTMADDAVFLGPDSYRFANLVRQELECDPPLPGATIVDIGTGAGVGAVIAAGLVEDPVVVGTDINPEALTLAAINASAAGCPLIARHGPGLAGLSGGMDIALANPPYVIDPAGRAYRHGGSMYGAEVSVEMARGALSALNTGGRFILYTGSAIIAGADALKDELQRLARGRFDLRYEELDPDVFSEELDTPGYEHVDRIAVVAAIFERATEC